MKTAILGGTFNPIHCGHLNLAREVVRIGYQRIIFVPAQWSSIKSREHHIAETDRLMMLTLALDSIPWAVLWDGELKRSGLSYSIDTIDELTRNGMIREKPGFIIGDDLMGSFPSWKEADRLAASTTIIIGRRKEKKNTAFPYPYVALQNPLYPYASTQVRKLVSRESSMESILPLVVIAYIRDRKLYGCQ